MGSRIRAFDPGSLTVALGKGGESTAYVGTTRLEMVERVTIDQDGTPSVFFRKAKTEEEHLRLDEETRAVRASGLGVVRKS